MSYYVQFTSCVYGVRSETFFDNLKTIKIIENAFHFTIKALFVLKIFKFLP